MTFTSSQFDTLRYIAIGTSSLSELGALFIALTFLWIFYLESKQGPRAVSREEDDLRGQLPFCQSVCLIVVSGYHRMILRLAITGVHFWHSIRRNLLTRVFRPTDVLNSAVYLMAQFHHSETVCRWQALAMLFLDLCVLFWSVASCFIVSLHLSFVSRFRYACLAFELLLILVHGSLMQAPRKERFFFGVQHRHFQQFQHEFAVLCCAALCL